MTHQSLFNPIGSPPPPVGTRTGVVSVAAHGFLLLVLFGVFRFAAKPAPYRLPGTEHGVRTLTYFSPGSLQHAQSQLPKAQTTPAAVATVQPPHAVPKPQAVAQPAAEAGSGASAQSGLGHGNISIALQTFYPHPTPDLSGLPHGAQGDVILNAVIDEHGRIAELTLVQGLGPSIDDAVIATVRQWSYKPATRDGVPVASEQELHFHYERG